MSAAETLSEPESAVEPEEALEASEAPEEPEAPADEGSEAPQQPQPPPTEKELEQMFKRLGNEAQRHRARVEEIMGSEFEALVPCELCEEDMPGFRLQRVPEYEKVERVMGAIGLGDLAELQDDPEARTCDLCAGLGVLRTGSKVIEQLSRPCPKCGANGWTNAEQRNAWDSTMRAKATAATLQPPAGAGGAPSAGLPATDAWGRHAGHEFYGKNPVYMTEAERARDLPGVA